MGTAGQERARQCDAGDAGFYFVGDALALDLVNTEDVARGTRRDLLAAPGAATRWWRAAQIAHPGRVTVHADEQDPLDDASLRDALVALRSPIRGIFGALAAGMAPAAGDVARLNATLATGREWLEFTAEGAPRLAYRSADRAAPVLLPIAISAVRLATEGERHRLHACANGRCILLFYDTTKSGTRRWCSLGCKDRDRKMRGYRRRGGEA